MMVSGFSYDIDVFFPLGVWNDVPVSELKMGSLMHWLIGSKDCSPSLLCLSSFAFKDWEDVNDVDLMNYVRALHQYNIN